MHTEVAATILTYALSEIKLDDNARYLFNLGFVNLLGSRPSFMPAFSPAQPLPARRRFSKIQGQSRPSQSTQPILLDDDHDDAES